jgi:hypothetical protein
VSRLPEAKGLFETQLTVSDLDRSIAFCRDPDGHLIECLAMLDEPARPERGIVPWSRWYVRAGWAGVPLFCDMAMAGAATAPAHRRRGV